MNLSLEKVKFSHISSLKKSSQNTNSEERCKLAIPHAKTSNKRFVIPLHAVVNKFIYERGRVRQFCVR